jgi:hypothetical protein
VHSVLHVNHGGLLAAIANLNCIDSELRANGNGLLLNGNVLLQFPSLFCGSAFSLPLLTLPLKLHAKHITSVLGQLIIRIIKLTITVRRILELFENLM